MAIFGRITARQRLRRATRESLAIPAFSSPIDCTPWVTGGLWPAELTAAEAETSRLAEYLKADLERIARSSNDELTLLRRAALPDLTRRAQEARIIDEARARAERRVESTIRQLQTLRPGARGASEAAIETDQHMTQVIAAVGVVESADGVAAEWDPERRWRLAEGGRRDDEALGGDSKDTPGVDDAPRLDDTQVIKAGDAAQTVARHRARDAAAMAVPPPQNVAAGGESGGDRLNRLLEFVVRQEPRLHWAVADYADGTTVVVTDLAHGWIPPGVAVPEGVRLLVPGRRSAKAASMVAEATHAATYAPGDSLRRSAEFATTKSSQRPRELPPVDDLGGLLITATDGRDGLPRMVHAMASSAAAGGRIVDQEVDVLRVHLDTARYQLMVQYPSVDSALVLNCLLLAATEAFVIGDRVSANYHLAWFQELAALPS